MSAGGAVDEGAATLGRVSPPPVPRGWGLVALPCPTPPARTPVPLQDTGRRGGSRVTPQFHSIKRHSGSAQLGTVADYAVSRFAKDQHEGRLVSDLSKSDELFYIPYKSFLLVMGGARLQRLDFDY